MLFRSDRIYHPDHLYIKAKLDLILRKLQNLKLKVEGLGERQKGESRDDLRDDRGEENTNRRRDDKYAIICQSNIDLPTINDIYDPNFFTDRMTELDY